MSDFKVRRGLSSTLFKAPGEINPKLILEQGTWYLCTDTADLFVCVTLSNGQLSLKQVNADSFVLALDEIKEDIKQLKAVQLYQQISGEDELPTDFNSAEFNPNVTYYTIIDNGEESGTPLVCTYIFDIGTQSYMCTNSTDINALREAINAAVDNVIDEKIEAKVPVVVEDTIHTRVLFGGSSQG